MNRIVYNDFAALAEKYAAVPAEGSSDYQSGGDLLNLEARELINYASFTGSGINLLDTSLEFAEAGDNIGYVSSAASNAQRVFSPAVDIVIDLSNGYYSAPGITFHFWQNYCTEVSVKWYSNSIEISSATFYPIPESDKNNPNMLTYYGENAVENFNKVVISFVKTEIANQFVKLAGIDLGKQREITDFHSNIEMYFEIDPDAADVPGATCDFTARIYDFEPNEAQTLYVYGNNKLFGKFSVENVTPNGKNRYSIECCDDVMNLDGSSAPVFGQGTHGTEELITAISSISNIDIDISQITETELTGFIEANNSNRYAVALIAFGTACFVTGYGSKALRFIKPNNRKGRVITSAEILGKAEYRKTTPYTAIVLNSYENDFNTITETRTSENPLKKATISANEKVFEKYSLLGDIDTRFSELIAEGFSRNEITARIELNDESLGDILTVETPYNGLKTGIVKAMEISLGNKALATLTLIERDFVEGGES